LLAEGLDRLRPFAPRCQDVDVDRLIADTTIVRQRLETLGAEAMREVDVSAIAPRIRFTP
jgi:hypothetical protein